MAREEKELIDIEDAQRSAERFIISRQPKAKMIFDKATLRAYGTEPVYEIEGEFSSGGLLSSKRQPFKIQVHAYTSKIVGYQI